MDSAHDQAGLMTGVVEPGEPNSEFVASRQTSEKELDLTKEQLKKILDGLGPYSDTINDDGKKLMLYFTQQFSTYFTWVKTTVTTKSTSIIFLNIIRYFYKQIVLENEERRAESGEQRTESGELHIVLVGEARYNDQVRPARWLIPGGCITDTILYSPWNCRIDAKVAYGIATGELKLQNRAFRNNQVPIMQQQQVPDHWNSIRAKDQQPFPEIILGQIKSTADWLTQSVALDDQESLYQDRNRFIIQYPPVGDLAKWLPEMPLYQIIGVIKILLRIISPYKATIHLAADFKYNGDAEPDEEMLKDQYAFTPNGTVMTTQDMQFTDLEFPELYGLFRSMFRPAPPQ